MINPTLLANAANIAALAQALGATSPSATANLATNVKGGTNLAASAQSGATPAQPGTPQGGGSTPGTPQISVTPQQQAILQGINAPAPAAKMAAIKESQILEGQNPGIQSQLVSQPQTQQQQMPPGMGPSALGGGLSNFSQQQAAQGAQAAQTASEKGFWEKMADSVTGAGLQGEDLDKWRNSMTMGAVLGNLGSAIGGNTMGGRIGNAVYQFGAGNLAAKNAELRETEGNNLTKAFLSSLSGGAGALGKAPISGPAPQQSPTLSAAQGSTLSGAGVNGESFAQASEGLDDIMARLRRLNGVA